MMMALTMTLPASRIQGQWRRIVPLLDTCAVSCNLSTTTRRADSAIGHAHDRRFLRWVSIRGIRVSDYKVALATGWGSSATDLLRRQQDVACRFRQAPQYPTSYRKPSATPRRSPIEAMAITIAAIERVSSARSSGGFPTSCSNSTRTKS